MPGNQTLDCCTCSRCLLSFLQTVWAPGTDGVAYQITICINCTLRDADMRRSAEAQAAHFLAERDAATKECDELKHREAQLLNRLQRVAG
jgi:hypothetical protein